LSQAVYGLSQGRYFLVFIKVLCGGEEALPQGRNRGVKYIFAEAGR